MTHVNQEEEEENSEKPNRESESVKDEGKKKIRKK